jgi:hypothetical protein
MVLRRALWTRLKWRPAMVRFGPSAETLRRRKTEVDVKSSTAVWQARLIMLVMINVAQLWILAATVDAALARHYSVLLPLIVASGVCFVITLSIVKWWRPTSRRKTSTGYVRENDR